MKFINSKLLQEAKGKKIGKYLLTIEVTDNDINNFEEFGGLPTAGVVCCIPDKRYRFMERYLRTVYHSVFQRLWRKYD